MFINIFLESIFLILRVQYVSSLILLCSKVNVQLFTIYQKATYLPLKQNKNQGSERRNSKVFCATSTSMPVILQVTIFHIQCTYLIPYISVG